MEYVIDPLVTNTPIPVNGDGAGVGVHQMFGLPQGHVMIQDHCDGDIPTPVTVAALTFVVMWVLATVPESVKFRRIVNVAPLSQVCVGVQELDVPPSPKLHAQVNVPVPPDSTPFIDRDPQLPAVVG